MSSLSVGSSNKLRHLVTSTQSFKSFERKLVREWLKEIEMDQDGMQLTFPLSTTDHPQFRPAITKITPRFSRLMVRKFNEPYFAQFRIAANQVAHSKVRSRSAYCALCSWQINIWHNGKYRQKKSRTRQTKWCLNCRAPVCLGCCNFSTMNKS